jgi:pimeloyl-ACP methyl ester carboxylesterase
MGMDHTLWDEHRERFSKMHQLSTFDQCGSGDSDHPDYSNDGEEFYSVDTFGDDLRAVLDELGIEKASILGFSMGAIAVFYFATRWPQRVDRLILVSAMASRLPDEIIQRARVVENTLEKATPHGFQGCFHVTIDRPSLLGDLHRIKAPTLVMVGERDKHYVVEAAILLDKIADAKKITVNNAGHAITVQQRQVFENEIMAFLQEPL